MRRLLPIAILATAISCNTPGTPAGETQGPEQPNEAEMIANLKQTSGDAPPVARVLAPIPPLPQDAWLQVTDRSARISHVLRDDGRYTVAVGDAKPRDMPALSSHSPESASLHPAARDRLLDVLAEVRFASLAPHLPPPELDLSVTAPATAPHPWAFSVRDPTTARIHTVEITADAALPASFGQLEPLWVALDREVFGRWLESAVHKPPG